MPLITIEDLLGNAKEIEKKEKATEKHTVKLKKLDKELEIRKVAYKEWMDILDSSEDDKDAEIIYSACEMLHDEHLIERLECKDNPTEVVRKVLDKRTVFHLAKYILDYSELSPGSPKDFVEKVLSDIKN